METIRNRTERKAKIKMGKRREKRPEKDGSEELEPEGAREEAMKINNCASQNS
jgi:hypothetical protein